MKMGYERLGDVNDFVLVALNYRVGPLGKISLAWLGLSARSLLAFDYFDNFRLHVFGK